MLTLLWTALALAAPSPSDLAASAPHPGSPDGAPVLPGPDAEITPYVVGGADALPGAWPDVASVDFSCTATLIHPRFVVTADHCTPGNRFVVVGMQDNRNGVDIDYSTGEPLREGVYVRNVAAVHRVPRELRSPYYGPDIALIELEEAVGAPPRVIADDCVLAEYLEEGAEVAVVGWGATGADGRGFTSTLQEGYTSVQTPDCSVEFVETERGSVFSGCDPYLEAAEIGAGGDGVDACFGDSGGPLYLMTSRGPFLLGVTSRAYSGVPQSAPCLYGGIYTRPDAYRDWMEEVIGEPLPRATCSEPPEVDAEDLVVGPGRSKRVQLEIEDDDSDRFTIEVVVEPAFGRVEIDGDEVFYTADDDARGEEDSFVLRVSDDGSAEWPETPPAFDEVEIDVEIRRGCGGCSGAGGPGSAPAAGLALLALVGLRRRTRR